MANLIYPPLINGLQKSLSAQLDEGVTASATLNNVTNIQNLKGLMVIDRIDASGAEKDPAVREYISFTGTSGSTVVGLTRGLAGTTDQDHAVGAIVEFVSDVVQQQAILDVISAEHNQDGTHKTPLNAFWNVVPGTPTGVSDTQFTITDTGNANKYDLMFKKGVIIKWTNSAGDTFKLGMVTASSYSNDAVTITIKGSAVASGDKDFKYCMLPAEEKEFIVVGTLGTGTDLARTHYPRYDVYPLCADAYVKTAGSTNATQFDILDDGTSIMPTTTTISIASAATTGLDYACNAPTTAIAKDSVVTLSITGVSTTPPVEAYVKLFVMPVNWRYLA